MNAHRIQYIIGLHSNMPRKTHFTYPLNKAADITAPTPRGRGASHTSEKIPLGHAAKRGTSSKASELHSNMPKDGGPTVPLSETSETYPLRLIDPDENAEDIGHGDNTSQPSNVSLMCAIHVSSFLMA
jgi:hypothetical protein